MYLYIFNFIIKKSRGHKQIRVEVLDTFRAIIFRNPEGNMFGHEFNYHIIETAEIKIRQTNFVLKKALDAIKVSTVTLVESVTNDTTVLNQLLHFLVVVAPVCITRVPPRTKAGRNQNGHFIALIDQLVVAHIFNRHFLAVGKGFMARRGIRINGNSIFGHFLFCKLYTFCLILMDNTI
jgi:hypothetical protein